MNGIQSISFQIQMVIGFKSFSILIFELTGGLSILDIVSVRTPISTLWYERSNNSLLCMSQKIEHWLICKYWLYTFSRLGVIENFIWFVKNFKYWMNWKLIEKCRDWMRCDLYSLIILSVMNWIHSHINNFVPIQSDHETTAFVTIGIFVCDRVFLIC